MSVQALSWVFDHCPEHVPPQPRLVLMSVANHAGPRGENSYPSVATIARETGMNPRQVQRWTAWLVAEQLLTVKVQGAGDTRIRADRRPNQYTLPGMHDGVASTTPRDGGPRHDPDEAGAAAPIPAATGVDETLEPSQRPDPDGVSSTTPRDGSRGDTDGPTGWHPRSHGVALTAPRGGADATQTVIEPKTEPNFEPRGEQSFATETRSAGHDGGTDQDPHQPVGRRRGLDLLRRARQTIPVATSLEPVGRLMAADRALADELGLSGDPV